MDATENPPDDALEAGLGLLFLSYLQADGDRLGGLYRALRAEAERLRSEGMAWPVIREHLGGSVADYVGQGFDTAPARMICKTMIRMAVLDAGGGRP